MNIKCPKCHQAYRIPDEKTDKGPMYFICEECGHRIVVRPGKRDSWLSCRPLQFGNAGTRDILEGVQLGFNKKNLLISMAAAFFIIVCSGISGILFYYGSDFFSGNLAAAVVLAVICLVLVCFIYDFHIYLISRNIFHNIRQDKNICFSEIGDQIKRDAYYIFFFSGGCILLFSVLLVPLYVFKINFGFVYAGLFYVPIIAVFSLFAFTSFFKGIFCALLASGERNFSEFITVLKRMIVVENINIPLYSFFSWITASIGYLIFEIVILSGTLFVGLLGSALLGSNHNMDISAFFNSSLTIDGLMKALDLNAEISTSLWAAGVLILMAVVLVQLFAWALFINWKQGISCAALYIMEVNPGRSMHGSVLLVLVSVLFFAVFFGLTLFI